MVSYGAPLDFFRCRTVKQGKHLSTCQSDGDARSRNSGQVPDPAGPKPEHLRILLPHQEPSLQRWR